LSLVIRPSRWIASRILRSIASSRTVIGIPPVPKK
jgi:hypothetical protein